MIYAGKICGFNRLRIGIDTFPCDKKPDYVLFLNQFDNNKASLEIKNGDSIKVILKNGILSSSLNLNVDGNYRFAGLENVTEVYSGNIFSFSTENPGGFCMIEENKKIRNYSGYIYENLILNDYILLARTSKEHLVYLKP